jgi:hypothetical protein
MDINSHLNISSLQCPAETLTRKRLSTSEHDNDESSFHRFITRELVDSNCCCQRKCPGKMTYGVLHDMHQEKHTYGVKSMDRQKIDLL